MEITDIRNLSETELVSKARDARQEIFNLRLQQRTGSVESPAASASCAATSPASRRC